MNTTTASPETDTKSTTYPEASDQTRPQPLYRPFQDRMLAGVAVGIARYLGVDVTVVRIVLAVLTVVGGVGVPLYLAGWLGLLGAGQVVEQPAQVRLGLGPHRLIDALVELGLVEAPVAVVLGQAIGDLGALGIRDPQVAVGVTAPAHPGRAIRR